ncbi:hypothetical protein IWX90DRAFT_507456, partial [Phyllosticta citrichinensis]
MMRKALTVLAKNKVLTKPKSPASSTRKSAVTIQQGLVRGLGDKTCGRREGWQITSEVGKVEGVLGLLGRLGIVAVLHLRIRAPLALPNDLLHLRIQREGGTLSVLPVPPLPALLRKHLGVDLHGGVRRRGSALLALALAVSVVLGHVNVHRGVHAAVGLVDSSIDSGGDLLLPFQLPHDRVEVDGQHLSREPDPRLVTSSSLPAPDLVAQQLLDVVKLDAQGGQLLELAGVLSRVEGRRQDSCLGLVDASFGGAAAGALAAGDFSRLDVVVHEALWAVFHERHERALGRLVGRSQRGGVCHGEVGRGIAAGRRVDAERH